ncbi:GMC oxidoreductase [Salipiger sp. CCB-MM3]|uniref:GMC oxidoreductase n=1 Tax=Salipiger sp. CCB-MM3 TaxID=1792508 RepID=UPI00187D95FE|nr:GMC oxidoreductase [Salipiger sp. CCB-MM3]
MADIVVGSGPSGVAVATALLARGRKVLMLDGGRRPEAAALAARDKLGAMQWDSWSREDIAAYTAPCYEAPRDGQVRRFGSDFAMVPGRETFSDPTGVDLRASLAVGGLSNVWGSAVLPYAALDIADWPLTEADLRPHYRKVAQLLTVSGTRDQLSADFPDALPESARQIPPTPQARTIMSRLSLRQSHLSDLGIRIGAARQAVSSDCTECGLCQHGCPYGYIWSATATLNGLKLHPNFRYSPGMIVQSVREDADGVVLQGAQCDPLQGDRVYLAAGVLGTSQILLSSPLMRGRTLTLKDSQQAFMPMLHHWAPPKPVDAQPFTTLPQLFAELSDPAISPYLVHAQLYSWNDFYAREMQATYGRRLPGSAPLWKALARRLIVAQIFLHSTHSARINLRLAPDGRLDTKVHPGAEAAAVLDAASGRFARAMRLAGLHALTFARRDGPPGSSFHVGSSLPMTNAPAPSTSDLLGRPEGAQRIHIVDASVLPTVPSTTITFSVMANAHRIGAAQV